MIHVCIFPENYQASFCKQTKEMSATGFGSGSASGSTTRCSSPDNTDANIPSTVPKPVCTVTRGKVCMHVY